MLLSKAFKRADGLILLSRQYYGHRCFSFRTENIYCMAQLAQEKAVGCSAFELASAEFWYFSGYASIIGGFYVILFRLVD